MSKSHVLDASAVLDFVEGGPGGKRVEQLFKDVLGKRSRVLMSVVNWGEVFHPAWQQHGAESARRLLADLSRLPLVVPVDLSQSLQAGETTARHKIPYVDCIAAGLATLHQAVLVTSDPEFEKLGRRVEVLWIARS